MGIAALVLSTVRTVESWTATGRIAGVLLLAAAVIGAVLWAVVRVVDAA